jgi:hypothetical protein
MEVAMRSAVSTPSSYHLAISTRSLQGLIRLAVARLGAWLDARADRIGRAAVYQHLSKLSDAELELLGIRRGELHRCISKHSE